MVVGAACVHHCLLQSIVVPIHGWAMGHGLDRVTITIIIHIIYYNAIMHGRRPAHGITGGAVQITSTNAAPRPVQAAAAASAIAAMHPHASTMTLQAQGRETLSSPS